MMVGASVGINWTDHVRDNQVDDQLDFFYSRSSSVTASGREIGQTGS